MKSLPLKEKNPFSARERTTSPLQFEEVVPVFSRNGATTRPGFSQTLSSTGKVPVALGTGASWKSEYSRLADEIQVRHCASL